MHRTHRRFVSVALAASLLVGCGSDDDDAAKGVADSDTTEASSEESTTTTAAASEDSTTTAGEETTTTVAASEDSTTTTAAAAATLAGPVDGVPFTDADGIYSMLISPGWIDASGEFPGASRAWLTGNTTATFAENVNIVTSSVPETTPLDLAITASIDQLDALFEGFTLIDSGVISGLNHPELGFLEYTADQDGVTVRFVQTFGLWNGDLVVFTGSTDGADGEAAVDALLEYAVTIAPPVGS